MAKLAETRDFSNPRSSDQPDAFPEDPPGYDLFNEIGRGGMGVVYRAHDRAMNRVVAVKLLSAGFAPNSTTATRFLAEAQITGRLQHPGVPAVYHVGKMPDGRPFLAMKLIQGETLDAVLESSEDLDKLAVFETIALTIGYAHAEGVIHRDLKPENVMVGSFGEVQVLDWGLAKVLPKSEPKGRQVDTTETPEYPATKPNCSGDGSFTQDGRVMGTPAYMSPEQALGEFEIVDRRTDVFGLGAILCALLTGKPPFTGLDAESIRLAAERGQTGDACHRLSESGAAPGVVDLCKRCMSPDRSKRPRDAGVVAMEVHRLREAGADRARLEERIRIRAERTEELTRHRRIVRFLGGALLLGLLGVSFGLAWKERSRALATDALQTAEANEHLNAEEIDALRARIRSLEQKLSLRSIAP